MGTGNGTGSTLFRNGARSWPKLRLTPRFYLMALTAPDSSTDRPAWQEPGTPSLVRGPQVLYGTLDSLITWAVQ